MKLTAVFLLVPIACVWDTNATGADSATSESVVVTEVNTQDESTLMTDLQNIQPNTTTSPAMFINSTEILYESPQLIEPNINNSVQSLKDQVQVKQNESIYLQLKECQEQVNNLISAHFAHLNYLHKYWERLLRYHVMEISKYKNDTASLSREIEMYKRKLQELSGDSLSVRNSSKEATRAKTYPTGTQASTKLLCEKGATVETLNKGLLNAITVGNQSLVSNYLECGADPNVGVHLAANYGLSETVELLLDKGADINLQRKKDNWTPLHAAVHCRHLDVVSVLLRKGARTDVGGSDKCTPLHQASSSGNVQIVQKLLEFSASPELSCQNGSTPLHTAAKNNRLKVVSVLLEHGADVNGRGSNNQTALYLAARCGNEEIVKLLIKHNANIDLPRMDGRTALYAASELNHTQTVKPLLEAGADPNMPCGPFSRTPLYIASWKGNLEIVKLLIKHKSDINLPTKYGWTPLHVAAEYNHIEIAKALLEAGANVDMAGGQSSTTPLYMATMYGNQEIVKLLIKHKANVSLPTIYGWTALHDACELNHIGIAKALIEAGADVNVKHPDNGFTPLHCAAYYGNLEVVKLLVNKGANVKQYSTDEFKTPRDYALSGGHKQIAEYLGSVGG